MKISFVWNTSRLRKECLFEGPLGLWWKTPSYDPPRRFYVNLRRTLAALVLIPLTIHLGLGLRQYWRERSMGHPTAITYLDVVWPGNEAELREKRQADRFRAGLAAAADRKLDVAITHLKAGLAEDPDKSNPDVVFTLGTLLLDTGHPGEAFSIWQDAIEDGFEDPASIDKCLDQAVVHQNDAFILGIAPKLLARKAMDDSLRARIETLYGKALVHEKRWDDAAAWAVSAPAETTPLAVRAAVRTEALIHSGNRTGAASLAAAGTDSATDTDTALVYASALGRLSQPDTAKAILHRVTADPDLTPAQQLKALELAYHVDPTSVPALIRNCTSRFGENRRSLFDLAVFLAQQPDSANLRELAAHEIRPDVAELFNTALAVAFAAEGQTYEARQQLESDYLVLHGKDQVPRLMLAPGLSEIDQLKIRNFWTFTGLLILNLDFNTKVTQLSRFLDETDLAPELYEIALVALEKNGSLIPAHEVASIATRHFPFINLFQVHEQRIATQLREQTGVQDRPSLEGDAAATSRL